MINYDIKSTGSHGNAVIIESAILLDCGVPFKLLNNQASDLKLVLLTHIHTDHFRKATIARLAKERPLLRFGCCKWMIDPLLASGVLPSRIDLYTPGKEYLYDDFVISAFNLQHNVENCGYRIFIGDQRMIYATDTCTMAGVEARDYDLYMIEANYDEETIKRLIIKKEMQGEYAYEKDVMQNHLSVQQCNEFIYSNMKKNDGQYIYMHQHRDIDTEGTNE